MEQQLIVPKSRKSTTKSKRQYRVHKATGCALGHRGDTCAGEWRHLGGLINPIWKPSLCVPAFCLVHVLLHLFSLAYTNSLLQIQDLPFLCLDFRHLPCFTPISLCPMVKFPGFDDLLECAVLARVPSCLLSWPHAQEAAETFLVLHYHLLLKKKTKQCEMVGKRL